MSGLFGMAGQIAAASIQADAMKEATNMQIKALERQKQLKDTETDLREVVAWARERARRITIRLVKGAYWDYETVIAQQKRWPVPVFARKAETDAHLAPLS